MVCLPYHVSIHNGYPQFVGCIPCCIYCSSRGFFISGVLLLSFRKPFTAGTYEGLQLWGIQFKIVLVMAQVAGYALSKFIGIRVISGLNHQNRIGILTGIIAVALLSFLGFAITPFPGMPSGCL